MNHFEVLRNPSLFDLLFSRADYCLVQTRLCPERQTITRSTDGRRSSRNASPFIIPWTEQMLTISNVCSAPDCNDRVRNSRGNGNPSATATISALGIRRRYSVQLGRVRSREAGECHAGEKVHLKGLSELLQGLSKAFALLRPRDPGISPRPTILRCLRSCLCSRCT